MEDLDYNENDNLVQETDNTSNDTENIDLDDTNHENLDDGTTDGDTDDENLDDTPKNDDASLEDENNNDTDDTLDEDSQVVTLYRTGWSESSGDYWTDEKPTDRMGAKIRLQTPIYYKDDEKPHYNNREAVQTGEVRIDKEGFVIDYDTRERVKFAHPTGEGNPLLMEEQRLDDMWHDIEAMPSDGRKPYDLSPDATDDTESGRNILAARRGDFKEKDGRLITGAKEIYFGNSMIGTENIIHITKEEKLPFKTGIGHLSDVEKEINNPQK